MDAFEFSVPVLVVGGGACGAVAALAARAAGADVLVIERDAQPLGTTAMSQGLVCAAGTAAQREHGIDDDAARFFTDILAKTRGQTDHALARTIAHQSGPCLDWLVSAQDLPWTLDIRFGAAYGHSRERVHGWPGHGGTDMVQLLHARLAERGADVLTQARLTEVIAGADGTALGIEIERPGGGRERIGCAGLVLAAGGFAANAEMVRQHMPDAAAARCNGHEGSQGDAIRLAAQRLGAACADMGAYQGYAMLTDPQGVTVPPGFLVEGGVLLNSAGERFVDETLDISGMVHPVLAQPGGTAWLLFDHGIEERCAYVPETTQLRALNAMRGAAGTAALAHTLQADAGALSRTLEDMHAAHQQQRADATGRSWPSHKPAPPQPPYRALKVCGALYHTQGGLQVDAAARVQRADGSRLRNVFAGGGSARGVSGPSCWGYLPAMGLCSAVTLGWLAGRSAAAVASAAAPKLG